MLVVCVCQVSPLNLTEAHIGLRVVKGPVTLSRPEVPFFHDLKVTDHCRSDFSLERTEPLPTF